MLIQIESGTADSPRKVTITPNEGDPVTFTAPNIHEAHKLLRKGRIEGWDTLAEKAAKKKG